MISNAYAAFADLRVIDGDTIIVDGDKVRLEGIDAPEIRSKDENERKKAFKAKRRLEELFVNKDLIIESKGFDKYGRCLAYVSTSSGNVGDILLSEGLVTKMDPN